jgi:glutamate-1-semialdehyde 2,1-aminomutase
MIDRPKSKEIYERLCQVIPGGVNSPIRACKGLMTTPLVAAKGIGDSVIDADNNSYIDFCMSWGSLIHGHVHPDIAKAVCTQAHTGSSYGITTEIEAVLAEKIRKHMPSCEKVRFVSSGTEATMSAVRLARGYTQRSLMITFAGSYHGHADCFLGRTELVLPFNDEAAFNKAMDQHGKNIACVVIEPVAANMGVVPPKKGFLELLRKRTTECGALLFFDEVITGFRVGLHGAQGLYGITADLTALGKIVGGGYPLAAFGGKREIMDRLAPLGDVFQAGTLSGNPVAVSAGIVSLDLVEQPYFYEKLDAKCALIVDPVQKLIVEKGLPCTIHSVGSMFTLFFGPKRVENRHDLEEVNGDLFKKFFYKMLDNGIYMSPSQYEANFVSMAHTDEHLEKSRDCILAFLKSL